MKLNLKRPQALSVGLKAVRGLKLAPLRPLLSAFLVRTPRATSGEVSLEPGEEAAATVKLPADVPRDADFTAVKASLRPAAGGAPAPLEQTSVVTEGSGAPKTFKVDVTTPAAATSGLSLRLAGGDVFWTFSNPLASGDITLPELSEEINAYLDRVQLETGEVPHPIELPFLLTSQAGGKATIAIESLSYSRLKTQEWDNELDGTTRVDRNLELDFGATLTLPLERLAIQRGESLALRQIRLDVGGEFGRERMLEGPAAHDGRQFATVTNEYALAQSFELEIAVRCAGVSALLHSAAEAEVYVEIQGEETGAPAQGEPLAQGRLELAPTAEPEAAGWSFVRFDVPADLQPGVPYWLVIKGIRGRMQLAAAGAGASYLRRTLVHRGGKSWKRFAPQAAALFLRLVYLPAIDNQSAAVTLGLGTPAGRRPLDPTPEGDSLTLPAAAGAGRPELVIESQARGTLSLANVVLEYAPP